MNFKKFGSRVAAVSATLAVVASMSAISVSAADYGIEPSYEAINHSALISDPTVSAGEGSGNVQTVDTTTPKAGDTAAAEETAIEEVAADSAVQEETGTILSGDAVADAIDNSDGDEAVIEMAEDASGAVTLTEDAIAKVAENGVTLTVQVSAKKGSEAYSVSINPEKITSTDGAIDIGMAVKKSTVAHKVNGAPVDKNSIVISPSASGKISATLKVTLYSSPLEGMNKAKIKLYRINKNGEIEEVEGGIIREDGNISIEISDGSYEYVLSDKNLVGAAAKVSASKSVSKAKGAVPGTSKGVAALGLVDASAISVAAILAKKKKKK